MYLKFILMAVSAFGFGLLSSAGVFTVFVSVGLVPRFADKTHTAAYIIKYENAIVAGAALGCILSVFHERLVPILSGLGEAPLLGKFLLGFFGIFAGMFVGCFAIAIAELLNTIPIFERRVSLGKGSGIVILSIALGKTIGSLLYYAIIIQ